MYNIHLPISQFDPLNPAEQLQWKSLNKSVQVPLFWQGLEAHSSVSATKSTSLENIKT